MYRDEELLPISALNHFLYCKRRCALIHIERQWLENRFTAEGRVMHERVDRRGERDRRDVRTEYGLRLISHELRLVGQADVVEFHLKDRAIGLWLPYPVEYKRGKPKKNSSDRVQLCAQALCLEEMYQVSIPEAALFYGKTRRRQQVELILELRQETVTVVHAVQDMIRDRLTPEPVFDKRCESCSLIDFCLPRICGKKSVKSYLGKMVE